MQLDDAEACFTRNGFHRTTMQDLAREAAMSPETSTATLNPRRSWFRGWWSASARNPARGRDGGQRRPARGADRDHRALLRVDHP
ncbi:TetR family transcriptional regulator [Methylobacterium sp. UNC378MF]|uniref:TetR family transcriptional regulator n=1 Tax=Methylobacterium sp. UNC378MF TaxID=1502748 RepID=UPI001FCD1C96|nr:TetR family transcriptional regulator [Methylobacterium sp. UNC378MF]